MCRVASIGSTDRYQSKRTQGIGLSRSACMLRRSLFTFSTRSCLTASAAPKRESVVQGTPVLFSGERGEVEMLIMQWLSPGMPHQCHSRGVQCSGLKPYSVSCHSQAVRSDNTCSMPCSESTVCEVLLSSSLLPVAR